MRLYRLSEKNIVSLGHLGSVTDLETRENAAADVRTIFVSISFSHVCSVSMSMLHVHKPRRMLRLSRYFTLQANVATLSSTAAISLTNRVRCLKQFANCID